jgi:hypothetical protein
LGCRLLDDFHLRQLRAVRRDHQVPDDLERVVDRLADDPVEILRPRGELADRLRVERPDEVQVRLLLDRRRPGGVEHAHADVDQVGDVGHVPVDRALHLPAGGDQETADLPADPLGVVVERRGLEADQCRLVATAATTTAAAVAAAAAAARAQRISVVGGAGGEDE